MEESTELADNRLTELQKLQQDLQNVHQENNSMKVSLTLHYDFHLQTQWPLNASQNVTDYFEPCQHGHT